MMAVTFKLLVLVFCLGVIFSTDASAVFSVYDFGAHGDGIHNDTAAVQLAIDAAAAAGGGTVWLPANGTHLFGGGVYLFGHTYDGVTIQIDGNITVPHPHSKDPGVWPQCANQARCNGPCFPVCNVIKVWNVDGFTLTSKNGPGIIQGFEYDEHKKPLPPAGLSVMNSTNILWESVNFLHLLGVAGVHNCQHVTIRNMSIVNRGVPIEETGDLEIGGIGSHGEPWNSPWQYEVPLMTAHNITIRDSFVSGGDDNVCIKNDTSNVLVENVYFKDGHGATIGSIPDCSGCHGMVTNVTFRNITMGGNAPLKIKWWPNTTGEISNILYEDVTLESADTAVEVSAWYGAGGCPCRWIRNWGGPGQKTACKNIKWAGSPSGVAPVGGICGLEGNTSNNIHTKNITFRRLRGNVKSPGFISCRSGNPCKINFESVQLTTGIPWVCGNAVINTHGTSVTPSLPECVKGPEAALQRNQVYI